DVNAVDPCLQARYLLETTIALLIHACEADDRNMPVTIRNLLASDWPSVEEIYLAGIETGQATFETSSPPWESWNAGHLVFSRLAAVLPNGSLAGWAALSPVSRRAVYDGVAEVSVYVHPQMRGQGVGRQLLTQLIQDSEQNGIWTLQASIFPENEV